MTLARDQLARGIPPLPGRLECQPAWTTTSTARPWRQHALTVAGPMRPVAASDFDEFGGTVFVDWMRMTPNATPGAFVSRVFDANSAVDWKSIQWAAKTPAGTTLAISVRTGDTPNRRRSRTAPGRAFVPVASAGPLSLHSRYIQYRLDMTTTDPKKTAELEDIIISTGSAPVAIAGFRGRCQEHQHTFPPSGLGSLTYNDTDADVNDTLSVVAVTAAVSWHGRRQRRRVGRLHAGRQLLRPRRVHLHGDRRPADRERAGDARRAGWQRAAGVEQRLLQR